MSQPPRSSGDGTGPPSWRRPRGVASGTWEYVNQRSIADRYDQFVADTPLCDLDQSILEQLFPATDQPTIILDLGCGNGRTAIPLADRGYQLVGVDLSQSMLAVMMDGQDPNFPIMPLRCNLVDLDCVADRSVDHAICMFSTLGMIQGSSHRLEFMKHVARIVRPGGRFVVHVHNRWSALREPEGFRKLLVNWVASLRTKDIEFGDAVYQYRGLEKMFMHRFSRRELINILNRGGWEVEVMHKVSIDGSRIDKATRIPGGYVVVGVRKSV